MAKKLIGIVANLNYQEGRIWINSNYVTYYSTYGNVILIDPIDEEIRDDLDLLILPGGQDISPYRYNHYYTPEISQPNIPLETFDHITLPKYVEAGCPILAECRGFQSINVFLGGKLIPDLPDHPRSNNDGDPVHLLANDDKTMVMFSSSNHHQGLGLNEIAPNFTPLLFSHVLERVKEDKKWIVKLGDREDIVEAMIDKERRIFGVQPHPEKNYCATTGRPTCEDFDDFVRENVKKIM